MTRYNFILLLICCLLGSCDKEEISTFSVKDSSVYFTESSVAFSFRNKEDREKGIINIPFKLMGPTTNYDRSINFMIVDTLSNANNQTYSILPAVLKANENEGAIQVEVTNADSLLTNSLYLTIGIESSADFIECIPGNKFCQITWNDMLIKPASWRSWFYFFCRTYSTELHQVILDALGEDAYLLNTWGEKGKDENGVAYPRTTADMGTAMSRKLRQYVADYNAAHPDAPLTHSSDAILYTSYSKPSTSAANTPIVILNR